MFRIVCSGGIGDGLRNLSLFPHAFLYRLFGYRTGALFFQIQIIEAEVAIPGASLAHANFPDMAVFQALVAHCPSLRWRGLFKSKMSGVLLNRTVREAIKLTNLGQPRYFSFEVQLSREEASALPSLEGRPLIGIQTHLSGMKTKQWGLENWRGFLELLIEAQPELRIVLLDNAPAVEKLAFAEAISTTVGFNISQSICLVKRLHLVISVDSWAKYIAAANRVPQIIIVPDQTPEYPGESAEKLLSVAFAGIAKDPSVTLIGLQADPPALTLPCMADLRPEELLRQTLEKLRGLSLCESGLA